MPDPKTHKQYQRIKSYTTQLQARHDLTRHHVRLAITCVSMDCSEKRAILALTWLKKPLGIKIEVTHRHQVNIRSTPNSRCNRLH